MVSDLKQNYPDHAHALDMVVAIYNAWTLKNVKNDTEFQAFMKESDDGYDIESGATHGSASRNQKRGRDGDASVKEDGPSIVKQPRLGDEDGKTAQMNKEAGCDTPPGFGQEPLSRETPEWDE
jgi:hypothetical protein